MLLGQQAIEVEIIGEAVGVGTAFLGGVGFGFGAESTSAMEDMGGAG